MKAIIQACSQHMNYKNESRINMIKNKNMEYQNNYTNPNDYYDKNMCIRSMTNMIAKTKEITKYGSILNMGVSRTNHEKT